MSTWPSWKQVEKKWNELTQLEPSLSVLYQQAFHFRKAYKRVPTAKAFTFWYGRGFPFGMKERMSALVGWKCPRSHRHHAQLGTEEAYDVAYKVLFGIVYMWSPRQLP